MTTGSIGVFSGKFNLRGLYDKIGLKKELLARGKNALIYTEYRAWDENERARVQSMNRAFYEDFVKRAAEGRKKPFEAIDDELRIALAAGQGLKILEQGFFIFRQILYLLGTKRGPIQAERRIDGHLFGIRGHLNGGRDSFK